MDQTMDDTLRPNSPELDYVSQSVISETHGRVCLDNESQIPGCVELEDKATQNRLGMRQLESIQSCASRKAAHLQGKRRNDAVRSNHQPSSLW